MEARRNDHGRAALARSVLITLMLLLSPVPTAQAETPATQKSTPVPVVFGVRTLTPETPVNPQVAFVSQMLTLPEVVCNNCTEQDTWSRRWSVSQMTLSRDNTRTDLGWYVFNSGLKGIGISVQVDPQIRKEQRGSGMQLRETGELTVGLVRLGQKTGAGLAELPPADFTRTTTFNSPDGTVKYVQQDTIRVSADLRVPTCTSTASSLSFQLPEINQVWFQRNVTVGGYTDTLGSSAQLVVTNCSENTRNMRIRFIPSGAVTDSPLGPSTILVGRDEGGQDSGVGYLMKYQSDGFGRSQQGVVHWDRSAPLIVANPQAMETGDALTQGITVTLQAFYARPQNNKAITAGQIVAKGMYQISYD